MMETLRYLRFGLRYCGTCLRVHKIMQRTKFGMEDTKALGREVHICTRCGAMSIGEPVPKALQDFFNRNPHDDDLPSEERIAV